MVSMNLSPEEDSLRDSVSKICIPEGTDIFPMSERELEGKETAFA